MLARITRALADVADGVDGTLVEEKPTSTALHVRNADPEARPAVLDAVRSGPSTWDGVRTVEGKQVIELLISPTDKGGAVEALRERFRPDRVVVLGDDVTDEDAFAALGPDDLGIKIGAGATVARTVVDSQDEVAMVFRELARARRRALSPGPEPHRPGSLE